MSEQEQSFRWGLLAGYVDALRGEDVEDLAEDVAASLNITLEEYIRDIEDEENEQ